MNSQLSWCTLAPTNIGKKRDELLQSEFRELGDKLKSRTSKVIIPGILPVPHASQSRNRRILQMNMWLEKWCKGDGFKFLGH